LIESTNTKIRVLTRMAKAARAALAVATALTLRRTRR